MIGLLFAFLVFYCTKAQPKGEAITDPFVIQVLLNKHNTERQRWNQTNVTWSASLATLAINSSTNSGSCAQVHTGIACGENLAYARPLKNDRNEAIFVAANQWIYEKSSCPDACNVSAIGTCGHYTQMIWADTSSIGCAFWRCVNTTKYYSVVLACLYNPGGNMKNNGKYFSPCAAGNYGDICPGFTRPSRAPVALPDNDLPLYNVSAAFRFKSSSFISLTRESCLSYCNSSGSKQVAVQGRWCHCVGTSTGLLISNPNSSLVICGGDPTKYCGGKGTNQYQFIKGAPTTILPTLDSASESTITTESDSGNENSSEGLSGGAIAGIVIGCVVGVTLLLGVVMVLLTRKKAETV